MGKKRASKNKSHTDNVGTKEGEEKNNNKPAAVVMESSSAKDDLQSEISSKKGASYVDEKREDLPFSKSKCNPFKPKIKDTDKECEEKDLIIKKLKEENAMQKTEILELHKTIDELRAGRENLRKEKSHTVTDFADAMDVELSQVATSEQTKEKQRDVECRSFQQTDKSWEAEQTYTSLNVRQISTPWGAGQTDTSWDAGQTSTSLHGGQTSTPWGLKQTSTSGDKEESNSFRGAEQLNRSYGNKQQSNGLKGDVRSRSQADRRGKERVEHENDDTKFNRQRRQQEKWGHNQNYNIGRDFSGGRLKLVTNSEYKIVTEVDGDLFQAPEDNSIAHCVAEDMRMGSGIAVTFRQKFKCVDELLDQRKRQGDVAVLKVEQRYIYYLVTKRVSNGKPTMDTLQRSLKAMRDHVAINKVSKIAMPRIGCGLDRLAWDKVKPLMENVFSGLDVTITVYNYKEDDAVSRPIYYNFLTIKEAAHPVVDIEPQTAILCLCATDGSHDPVLQSLDRKFYISNEYRYATKVLGTAFNIVRPNYLICILFIREKKDDQISFKYFAQSLVHARKLIDRNRYQYIALEAFHDQHDELVMDKVVTLLRNCLNMKPKKEVWLCWPNREPKEL